MHAHPHGWKPVATPNLVDHSQSELNRMVSSCRTEHQRVADLLYLLGGVIRQQFFYAAREVLSEIGRLGVAVGLR
jgi:hypothetical protein